MWTIRILAAVVLVVVVAVTDVDAVKCYQCLGSANGESCRDSATQECRGEFDSCQTSVVNVLGYMTITRSCAIKSACDNLVNQFVGKCGSPGESGTTCYCCCDGDKCNANMCGWCKDDGATDDCKGSKSKSKSKCKSGSKKSGSKKSGSKESSKSDHGYVKCGAASMLASPLLLLAAATMAKRW